MAKRRQRSKRTLPPVGTRLMGKFKRIEYFAQIVGAPELKEGRGISYQGKIFSSMTAAAKEITKHSVNGWHFWRF